MLCTHPIMQVSWTVQTTGATNIEVQYRSTGSADIWWHDSNGIPSTIVVRMSDIKNLWTAKNDAPAGPFSSSWVNKQTVGLPSAGKYLVLSNYRIWLGNGANGFVKARVMLGSKEIGKVKMITERMHPTRKSFINYGGWLIIASAQCSKLPMGSIERRGVVLEHGAPTDRDAHRQV